MKPAAFSYYAPTTVEEALTHLAQHGDDAKVLAGGQSLVPIMNFRLTQPSILIDLNRVEELFYLRPDDSGGLRIGAMTRQRHLERHTEVAKRAPLVCEAVPYIAHPQIRNRGTVGGSLAHADPAAELPAVMVALGARFLLRNLERDLSWCGVLFRRIRRGFRVSVGGVLLWLVRRVGCLCPGSCGGCRVRFRFRLPETLSRQRGNTAVAFCRLVFRGWQQGRPARGSGG